VTNTTKAKTKTSKTITKTTDKRTRNKINSLARVMQLEHAVYQQDIAIRFADISDQLNSVQKSVATLRPDIREIVKEELVNILYNKMIIPISENADSSKNLTRYHPEEDIDID
jgi:hypothetical protein